jgi:predicted nucleic acid-binding protein
MALICFDTHIMIWGVKKEASLGQEANIEKAISLIKKCETDGDDIMVPSIVLAEFLCGVDPILQHEVAEFIRTTFIVPPFDAQAALKFTEMWNNKQNRGQQISRAEMKADYMIIATAVVKGADCIYSEDQGLKRFAQGFINVKPL